MSYSNKLLNILTNNNNNNITIDDTITISLYLVLITLNNHNYTEDIALFEINTIEDFLRKINNLKVKIQLKRKETEIDSLYNEIKEIYANNTNLINYYNLNKLSIDEILDSKEPSKLTHLIDDLTKEKTKNTNYKLYYDNLRNNFLSHILNNPFYIKNNHLYLTNETNLDVTIQEFYHIFNYLLNIDNYPKTYSNSKTNDLHIDLIKEIIKSIQEKTLSDKTIIPLILVNILTSNIPNYELIATDKFNIDNIKITDLYSLANNKNNSNKYLSHWQNITIPNEYLYNKINEITKKGMYYFKEDKFIIENNHNDFKISIMIDDLKNFLKNNLLNITSQSK